MDFYLTPLGDVAVSSAGDLAITEDRWRDYAQHAYLTTMTPISDFSLYPVLGTDLENLIGMPQTTATGEYGKTLIKNALNRLNIFIGTVIDVKACPISLQAIRFDIYITVGSKTEMLLAIEQNLDIDSLEQ